MTIYLLAAAIVFLLAVGAGLFGYHHKKCRENCPGCPYAAEREEK